MQVAQGGGAGQLAHMESINAGGYLESAGRLMVENYLGVYAKMTDVAYQPGGREVTEFARALRLGGIAD